MLQFALKYLSQGLSVIPLKPNGKEPLIQWAEYQKRRASPKQVSEWWRTWTNANIGIVTGSISGIVIVDLDGPEGLSSAASMGLSSPITVVTGKGRHLWFKSVNLNNGTVLNAVRVMPGVDLRGDGGYVVSPPSVHENGSRYRWVRPFSRHLLPPFPQVSFGDTDKKETVVKPSLDVTAALEAMTNGNRDNTLFSICSKLRRSNWSSGDARALLLPHAERVGAVDILEAKIDNVWSRYEPAPIQSQTPARSSFDIQRADSLTIHSPSDPNSWEQFNSRNQMDYSGSQSLKTGYPKLDEMLKGGIKSSRLFTVAARTGTGKTNWLIAAASNLCKQGFSVLLFSTEMAYTDIWARYLALVDGTDEFKGHKFYVCDSFAPNLEKIEEAIREIKPEVFMFDHINHVSEEQRELGAFMQGLNFLRRKYDVAGIVAAQLNRSADWVDLKSGERVTPRMSMIKGSGTIEQASSRVLLLSESRVGPDGSEIVGNLDKNDNGPKGLLHFQLKNNPYRMVEL